MFKDKRLNMLVRWRIYIIIINNNKIIYSFERKGDVSLIRRFKTPHKDEIKYQERKKRNVKKMIKLQKIKLIKTTFIEMLCYCTLKNKQ